MLRGRKKWYAITILVCCFMLVIGVVGCFRKAPIPNTEFTPEAWDAYPDLRHYMIKDMEEKIDILNLTQDEIIDVLGTNAAEIGRPVEGKHGAIIYRIAKINRHFYTFEVYGINISENGTVKDTYITQLSGGGDEW